MSTGADGTCVLSSIGCSRKSELRGGQLLLSGEQAVCTPGGDGFQADRMAGVNLTGEDTMERGRERGCDKRSQRT